MHLTVDVDMNEHDKLLMGYLLASCMTTFSTYIEFELTDKTINFKFQTIAKEDITVFLIPMRSCEPT